MNDNNKLSEKIEKDHIDPPKNSGRMVYFLIPCFLGLILFLYLFPAMGLQGSKPEVPPATEHKKEAGVRMAKVTGISEPETTQEQEIPEKEAKEDGLESEKAETETRVQSDNNEKEWQSLIFGTGAEYIPTSQIRVSGLSGYIKETTGFRESDFVKAASEFLAKHDITANTIEFYGSIECSASRAVAFQTVIDGNEDKILNVIYFPELSGKYLFTLQDIKEAAVPIQTESLQTEAVQAHTEGEKNQLPQTEAGDAYDAMKLSLAGIPDTLSNYLNNHYELQYTLYDYMYHNGLRDIDTVFISEYEITGRTAEFQIVVPGADMITGTYDKESNSYSYR